MEDNTISDKDSVSVVVDDENPVPVSLPDDTNDISQSSGNPDSEKRRRLEEEEDDKNGDRHRRKKKKSKDREREHKDKDKDRDRDSRKREHREKDRDGKDRGDRDHESKRRSKNDSEVIENEITKKDMAKEGSSSSRTSRGSEDHMSEADRSSRRDRDRESDRDRDRDRESRRSDRVEKDKEKNDKDTVAKDKDSIIVKDKESKEKEKVGERKRQSRSRSPAKRGGDDRERRDDRDRRDRESSRDRAERRNRERDRDRERERERIRERERDDRNRDRDRGGYRRRDRTASRSRSTERRRVDREKEREDKAMQDKKEKEEGTKRITLKDILTANPGISIPDAVQRLNVYNTAAALGQIDAAVASAALAGPATSAPMSVDLLLNGGIPVDPLSAAMAAAQAVAALNAQVVGASGPFGVAGEGGAVTKPHREVYIGNLPPGVTVSQLADFLNAALKQLGVAKEGGSVVSCWVSGDGHYGFAEVRTIDECNAALAYLNGVQIGINLIKVGRPKGYQGQAGVPMAMPGILPSTGLLGGMMNAVTGMMGLPTPPNPMMVGMGGTGTLDLHANVVMVSNLPMGITDDQVRELVSPFGALKAFNSIKTSSGTTQAAVFEYEDSASADGAVSGLDKLEIADHKLSVQRVPPHAAALLLQPSVVPVISPPLRKPPPPMETKDPLSELPPTSVIRLSNMTTPKELSNDEEYMELQEDVAEECNVYGVVRSVVIPRGHGQEGEEESEEVGMVYVHFTHSDGASKAKDAIAGRMFNGNIVRATFYPEELFSQQMYVLPEGYLKSEEPNSMSEGHREEEGENGLEYAASAEPFELSCAPIVDESLD